MPARIGLRLLVRHAAHGGEAIELGRERVVLVQERDLAVAEEQERAVADAHPLDALVREHRGNERRAHAGQDGVGAHLDGDGVIRRLQRLQQALLAARR